MAHSFNNSFLLFIFNSFLLLNSSYKLSISTSKLLSILIPTPSPSSNIDKKILFKLTSELFISLVSNIASSNTLFKSGV